MMHATVMAGVTREHCGAGEVAMVDRVGRIIVVDTGTGDVDVLVLCRDCRATGECGHGCPGHPCEMCGGTGRVRTMAVVDGVEVGDDE